MPNYINHVEKIRKDVLKGLPQGSDDGFYTELRILLTHIDQLERALAPFARAHFQNQDQNPNERPMIQVYLQDCGRARDVLDKEQSRPLYDGPKYEYPA